MFSFSSLSEWTKVAESVNGNEFYLDFDGMKKNSGNVFIWGIDNYLKPDNDDTLSEKKYMEVDCEEFKSKYLSGTFYSLPMGEGTPQDISINNLKEWQYPRPESVHEEILKAICNQ